MSAAAHGMTEAALRGEFALQVCGDCGAVQYPAREACRSCLSVSLDWRAQDGAGELIAQTQLHHSHEPFFREHLPWRIGLVRLDAGPTVIAHLHRDCVGPPARVRIQAIIDREARAVLVAVPFDGASKIADDPKLHALTYG